MCTQDMTQMHSRTEAVAAGSSAAVPGLSANQQTSQPLQV